MGRDHDNDRLAVARDGLRPLLLGAIHELAKLVLSILKRPSFHGDKMPVGILASQARIRYGRLDYNFSTFTASVATFTMAPGNRPR